MVPGVRGQRVTSNDSEKLANEYAKRTFGSGALPFPRTMAQPTRILLQLGTVLRAGTEFPTVFIGTLEIWRHAESRSFVRNWSMVPGRIRTLT